MSYINILKEIGFRIESIVHFHLRNNVALALKHRILECQSPQ